MAFQGYRGEGNQHVTLGRGKCTLANEGNGGFGRGETDVVGGIRFQFFTERVF